MAASPVCITPATATNLRRRPLELSQRRIEANRRNAMRSTGPRTAEGKARVARNPVKHGFFVGPERWTPGQHRDFEQIFDGLREECKPQSVAEEGCVAIMAESYVRMAAMWRYENIAALKYHQEQERELNERIAAADATEAARLRAERDRLIAAGLWRPTIPGPREARAIIRYSGSLDRTIRRASSHLRGLQLMRLGQRPNIPPSTKRKMQEQTHFEAAPRSGPEVLGRASAQEFEPSSGVPEAAEGPQVAPSCEHENAKTNPLSSMFTGNRHQRRRAKALAARRR